jgi:hypothetical protein
MVVCQNDRKFHVATATHYFIWWVQSYGVLWPISPIKHQMVLVWLDIYARDGGPLIQRTQFLKFHSNLFPKHSSFRYYYMHYLKTDICVLLHVSCDISLEWVQSYLSFILVRITQLMTQNYHPCYRECKSSALRWHWNFQLFCFGILQQMEKKQTFQ